MYNLCDLRRELKDNYQNQKILQVPTARMALCWILLYLSFFWSVHTLISITSVKDEREKFGWEKPVITLLTRKSSENKGNPSGIVSLGQIVVKELNFQVAPNLDQKIVLFSTLAIFLAPFI